LKLLRYWFEFEQLPAPSPINLGCGVTAYNYDDAIDLLKKTVFMDSTLPTIKRVLEDVDISKLDQGHVIPNMGLVLSRGVWFPLSF